MTETIYQQVGNVDHNPELRTWYYDDLGNRVDKKTGKFVVLVQEPVADDPELLTEEYDDNTEFSGC